MLTSARFFCSVMLAFVTAMFGTAHAEQEPDTSQTQELVTPERMVLIPAGTFAMGRTGADDFNPEHSVFVDSFYIDKYEVTNAEYFEFCRDTGHRLPEFWGMAKYHCGLDFPDHPVVGVSWRDADEYARWAGKRLPTEAEWEKAARGGLVGLNYPTGDSLDPKGANYAIAGRPNGTVAVGSFSANDYGLCDMAGNVNEWVQDYYDAHYYEVGPDSNPAGPEDGKFKVFRGGGWHSGPYCNRVYFRNALPPNWVDINVGFRCARSLRPEAEAAEKD